MEKGDNMDMKNEKSKRSNLGESDVKNSHNPFWVEPHPLNRVKNVIGIVSGKGGVGKSSITSQLAVTMRKRGFEVGIMDADITGASIPKAFGITEKALGSENGIFPVTTQTGIDIISMNLLLENDTDPVIWRGPVVAGVVKQFWSEVIWSEKDYLFVDMPPGTGDVPLTAFQSLPLDGIVMVTSPQELVSMIVEKATNMATMMHIPIIGLVENMSYWVCPECGKKTNIFGESRIDDIAKEQELKILGKIPINPTIPTLVDQGKIEHCDTSLFESMADVIESLQKIQD